MKNKGVELLLATMFTAIFILIFSILLGLL